MFAFLIRKPFAEGNVSKITQAAFIFIDHAIFITSTWLHPNGEKHSIHVSQSLKHSRHDPLEKFSTASGGERRLDLNFLEQSFLLFLDKSERLGNFLQSKPNLAASYKAQMKQIFLVLTEVLTVGVGGFGASDKTVAWWQQRRKEVGSDCLYSI